MTHKPKCPHCRKRVAYEDAEDDGHLCPHCWGDIAWSVPFGVLSTDGFDLAIDKTPSWSALTDQCGYCRKDFPYNSLDEGDGLEICRGCRAGKAKHRVEREARRALRRANQ